MSKSVNSDACPRPTTGARTELTKGQRWVPSTVDISVDMSVTVEVVDLSGTTGLEQKHPYVVWNGGHPHGGTSAGRIKFADASKRPFVLQVLYVKTPGKPTLVSLYATHWIINETGLPLQYYDIPGGFTKRYLPANHGSRAWRTPDPFMLSFHKAKIDAANPVSAAVRHKFALSLDDPEKGEKAKYYSDSISLNHPEMCTNLEVKSAKKSMLDDRAGAVRLRHNINVYVSLGTGPYVVTKMVYLRHFLTVYNRTDYNLRVRQTGADADPLDVKPQRKHAFS